MNNPDLVVNLGIMACFLSSLMTISSSPITWRDEPRRIYDNLALLGKVLACCLAVAIYVLALNPVILAPFGLYVLSTYFWATKTKRKGRLFVWTRDYDMKKSEQATINESNAGVGSAVCALIGNVIMCTSVIVLYNLAN